MATQQKNIFGKVDEEALAADRGRTNFFKAKAGNNRIRILPQSSEAQEKHGRFVPYIKTYAHFGVGLENKSVVCPIKSGVRASCPICKSAARLPEDARKKIAAKQRYRFVIWDYDNPDKGLQIWEIGYTVKDQLDTMRDLNGEFTDFENGYDLVVNRTGENLQSKYNCQADRNNTPLSKAIIDWATTNGIPELEATVTILTDAEIKAILEGDFDDDEIKAIGEEENEQRTTRAWTPETAELEELAADEDWESAAEEEGAEAVEAPTFGRNRLAGARTMTQASAGTAGTRRFAQR